jgi:hypothetical protein
MFVSIAFFGVCVFGVIVSVAFFGVCVFGVIMSVAFFGVRVLAVIVGRGFHSMCVVVVPWLVDRHGCNHHKHRYCHARQNQPVPGFHMMSSRVVGK